MSMNGQETEVKFFVRDLKKIELRLLELKARLIQPRVREINFRYDFPDESLRTKGQILRLRQDTNTVLTYKGPSEIIDGIFSRVEFETTMGDIETAKHILEALGYVQTMIYEKNRAIYDLNDCHIMLDELPYGDFVEIEGADASIIRQTTSLMDLKFELAVGLGYVKLFEIYNSKYGFPQGDLTFEALRENKPSPEELNVRAAD